MEEKQSFDPIYLKIDPIIKKLDDGGVSLHFEWFTLEIEGGKKLIDNIHNSILLQLFCLQFCQSLLTVNQNKTKSLDSLKEYSGTQPSVKLTKKEFENAMNVLYKFNKDAVNRHIKTNSPIKKPKNFKP